MRRLNTLEMTAHLGGPPSADEIVSRHRDYLRYGDRLGLPGPVTIDRGRRACDKTFSSQAGIAPPCDDAGCFGPSTERP